MPLFFNSSTLFHSAIVSVLLHMAKSMLALVLKCGLGTAKSTLLALGEEDNHTPELADKRLGFFVQGL
jgi:hypothetical protein